MLTLGDVVTHNELPHRVVRLIQHDQTLFEDETGLHVIDESYAMVKGPEGQIDFIVFCSEKKPYEGVTSNIKGLEPITWRKV